MDANALGQWRGVLKRLTDAELFELQEQVEEVTKLPGWERIVAYITAGHDGVLRSLTQGPTREYGAQCRSLGYLAGLAEAPTVVQAIAEIASSRRATAEQKAAADQAARQEESTP